jgi:hypothetical protein
MATMTCGFTVLRYCPVPATVPPVPEQELKGMKDSTEGHVATCTGDEGINTPTGLPPNFRASSFEMCFKIASILTKIVLVNDLEVPKVLFLFLIFYLELVSKISSRFRKKIFIILPIGLVEINVR